MFSFSFFFEFHSYGFVVIMKRPSYLFKRCLLRLEPFLCQRCRLQRCLAGYPGKLLWKTDAVDCVFSRTSGAVVRIPFGPWEFLFITSCPCLCPSLLSPLSISFSFHTVSFFTLLFSAPVISPSFPSLHPFVLTFLHSLFPSRQLAACKSKGQTAT